jgi:hypothetical protein
MILNPMKYEVLPNDIEKFSSDLKEKTFLHHKDQLVNIISQNAELLNIKPAVH